MKSVFSAIRDAGLLDEFKLARIYSEDLRAIEQLVESGGHVVALDSFEYAQLRCFRSESEQLVLIVEAEPVSPSLFALQGDRFTMAYSCSASARDWFETICQNDTPARPAVGGVLQPLINALEKAWLENCRTRALEVVQYDPRLDREGAEFFEALDGRLRALFAPDFLEIAPAHPDSLWADRPEGWTWISAARSEFQWPVPLTKEIEESLRRSGRPHVLSRLDEQAILLPPQGNAGLRSGLLIPLVYRGRYFGMIKLLFARDLVLSKAERGVLDTIAHGLSLIFDRTTEHLQTQRMAMVDGLTNLFNHRFFLNQLRTEFQRALRYGGTLTLLMIDVDGFKNYNDTFGHQAGNRVLTWVASQIRRTVRDIDVVARYGGEEFALILPEVRAEQGLIVAEKIRKAISVGEAPAEDGKQLAPITISCGVADSRGCKGPEEMIDRADRALYWVKRNGRNLVRLATLDG